MRTLFLFLIFSVCLVSVVSGQNIADSAANGAIGSSSAKVVARKASDTASHPYDAGRVRFLANHEDTGGQWSLIEIVELPGYKTPYHRHPDIDEAFYVVEGVLTAKIGNSKAKEFGPGSFVLIPRGTVHAQGNFGKTPVKLLLTVLPGGFEQFFADRVELFKKLRPGDAGFEDQIKSVIEKSHIEVLGPWEP